MGRMRSRRRTDEMNKIKRERNEKKELARLKKVLGIVDTDDNLQEKVMEIGEIKTAAQIKRVSGHTLAVYGHFRVNRL